MEIPKINIITDFSADLEAQYICFLAKNISLGTYQDGGFLILNHLEKGNAKAVHFPKLPYSPGFWRAINFNPNKNLSTQFPSTAIDEVKTLLANYKKELHTKEINTLQKEWKEIEKPFFEDVEKFLDFKKALSKVNKIDILITPFGTRGSFNPPRVGNNFNLLVTSRIDFPAGNIASGILQNLYIIENWSGGEIGDEKYLKRMSAINFVFENTIFKKYYPEYKNIIRPRYSFPSVLIKESNKCLSDLGFKGKSPLKKLDYKVFTEQEAKLLRKLIMKNSEIVSFDEVAEILWGANSFEKYSLEAMAKVIENIRRKTKEQGISKEVIFTKRGKGYFLNS